MSATPSHPMNEAKNGNRKPVAAKARPRVSKSRGLYVAILAPSDRGYAGSRIPTSENAILPRRWVNKDHHTRLGLLVDDEHARAKPVRCGPEAGLGAQVLRPTLFELLVCVGKLAGRERLTSAGCHDDARHG